MDKDVLDGWCMYEKRATKEGESNSSDSGESIEIISEDETGNYQIYSKEYYSEDNQDDKGKDDVKIENDHSAEQKPETENSNNDLIVEQGKEAKEREYDIKLEGEVKVDIEKTPETDDDLTNKIQNKNISAVSDENINSSVKNRKIKDTTSDAIRTKLCDSFNLTEQIGTNNDKIREIKTEELDDSTKFTENLDIDNEIPEKKNEKLVDTVSVFTGTLETNDDFFQGARNDIKNDIILRENVEDTNLLKNPEFKDGIKKKKSKKNKNKILDINLIIKQMKNKDSVVEEISKGNETKRSVKKLAELVREEQEILIRNEENEKIVEDISSNITEDVNIHAISTKQFDKNPIGSDYDIKLSDCEDELAEKDEIKSLTIYSRKYSSNLNLLNECKVPSSGEPDEGTKCKKSDKNDEDKCIKTDFKEGVKRKKSDSIERTNENDLMPKYIFQYSNTNKKMRKRNDKYLEESDQTLKDIKTRRGIFKQSFYTIFSGDSFIILTLLFVGILMATNWAHLTLQKKLNEKTITENRNNEKYVQLFQSWESKVIENAKLDFEIAIKERFEKNVKYKNKNSEFDDDVDEKIIFPSCMSNVVIYTFQHIRQYPPNINFMSQIDKQKFCVDVNILLHEMETLSFKNVLKYLLYFISNPEDLNYILLFENYLNQQKHYMKNIMKTKYAEIDMGNRLNEEIHLKPYTYCLDLNLFNIIKNKYAQHMSDMQGLMSMTHQYVNQDPCLHDLVNTKPSMIHTLYRNTIDVLLSRTLSTAITLDPSLIHDYYLELILSNDNNLEKLSKELFKYNILAINKFDLIPENKTTNNRKFNDYEIKNENIHLNDHFIHVKEDGDEYFVLKKEYQKELNNEKESFTQESKEISIHIGHIEIFYDNQLRKLSNGYNSKVRKFLNDINTDLKHAICHPYMNEENENESRGSNKSLLVNFIKNMCKVKDDVEMNKPKNEDDTILSNINTKEYVNENEHIETTNEWESANSENIQENPMYINAYDTINNEKKIYVEEVDDFVIENNKKWEKQKINNNEIINEFIENKRKLENQKKKNDQSTHTKKYKEKSNKNSIRKKYSNNKSYGNNEERVIHIDGHNNRYEREIFIDNADREDIVFNQYYYSDWWLTKRAKLRAKLRKQHSYPIQNNRDLYYESVY